MNRKKIRKQEKKRRRDMREKARGIEPREPRYMVVTQDLNTGRVSPEQAREAYHLLVTKTWIEPVYRPAGRFQQCYLNVDRVIDKHGGTKVLGWVVDLNSGAAARCRNKFAHVNLEGHAIWKTSEGQYVDVTANPESRAYRLIPHEAVCDYFNGGITFFDTFLLASTWNVGAHAPTESLRAYMRRFTKLVVPVRDEADICSRTQRSDDETRLKKEIANG